MLKIAFPTNAPQNLVPWIEPLKDACREFGIDTVREVASFLANIAVESKDLRSLEESLDYSVKGLRQTFGRHRITDEQCASLGRKPGERTVPRYRQEQIANILYGGEFGRKNLGNTMAGDGWRFRGQGPKQTTGRDNHTDLAKALGMPLDKIGDYVKTPVGGSRAAGFFWQSHKLDAKAATPGVADDRKAINGGSLGLDIVEARFNALIKELLRRGC